MTDDWHFPHRASPAAGGNLLLEGGDCVPQAHSILSTVAWNG